MKRGKYTKKPKIYKRGKLLWIDYTFEGQRVQMSTKLEDTPSNYQDVKEMLTDIQYVKEKLERYHKEKKRKVKLDDSKEVHKYLINRIPQFMYRIEKAKELLFAERDIKGKNRNMYENSIKHFIAVNGSRSIHFIGNNEYEKYKTYLLNKFSYNTAKTYINYFHIFLNFLIEKKMYNKKNPIIKLKKKENKFIRTIPEDEFIKILSHLKKTNVELYNFIFFLKLTGFRRDEALKMTWDKIKFDENLIVVTTFKDNDREDLFPMNLNNNELKKFLLEMYKSKKGRNLFSLSPDYTLRLFQKKLKELDLPKYTLHDIRRTFGSYYATKLNQIELMKLMRHKDITTTLNYYIHLDILKIADKV